MSVRGAEWAVDAVRKGSQSRIRAAGPVCHWQGHKFLSVHQHFSLPPVACEQREACRCSRIASRGAPLPPLQWTGEHDGNDANAPANHTIEENVSSIGEQRAKKRGERATARWAPSSFSYIASSHHPSVRGRITESHRGREMCWCSARWSSYPSPTTTHLIACIWTRAGGCEGAADGGLIDPTVCAEVSDESSGPVRSAMEPQWKGTMTSSAERVRKVPIVFKGT